MATMAPGTPWAEMTYDELHGDDAAVELISQTKATKIEM